jgi:hypothetical protein
LPGAPEAGCAVSVGASAAGVVSLLAVCPDSFFVQEIAITLTSVMLAIGITRSKLFITVTSVLLLVFSDTRGCLGPAAEPRESLTGYRDLRSTSRAERSALVE